MSDPTVYAWDRERDDYVSDAGVRCSAPRVVGLDDYAALRRERNELRAEIAQHAMVIASWKREELDWHEDNRALLAEAHDLLALAAGVALLPSGVPALPLAIRERIAAWLRAQEPPR